MTEAVARKSAQHCANLQKKPYVAIPAGNGQWMCERLEFIQKTDKYPLAQVEKMVVYKPKETKQ